MGGARRSVYGWQILALCFLFGCGADLTRVGQYNGPSLDAQQLLPTPASSQASTDEKSKLRDVKVELDLKSVSIDPTNIPQADAKEVRQIKFRGDVSFTVELNKEFAYNKVNWGLVFSNPDSESQYRAYRARDTEKKFKILSDGISPNSDALVIKQKVNGTVEFQIDLDEGEWALIRNLSSKAEGLKRAQIAVKLLYSIRDTYSPVADTDGTAILDAIRLQNDIGVIKDPTKVSVEGISSGTLTLSFAGPDSTEAILPSQNFSAVGASILSGYLLMYWKEGDCTDANWIFQSNVQYRKNPKEPDPTFSCRWGPVEDLAKAPGQCPFGCNAESDPSDPYFARDGVVATQEEVATPLETGACYKVVRVPAGRKTFSLTGLTDNATYGVVAWPLDSSGSLGGTRSSCVQGIPLKVPMAAAADTSASVRDCFVATAASGSPSSLTVHYWRVVRDTLLDPLGLSAYYYRHARVWAAWLESRPLLKPVVNEFLLTWGQRIVRVETALSEATRYLSARLQDAWSLAVSRARILGVQLDWRGMAEPTKVTRSSTAEEIPENEKIPTKQLRSVEEIDAGSSGAAAPPTKRIEAEPNTTSDLPPTKQLPPAGGLESDGSKPSKDLPPPLTSQSADELDRKSRFPEGSAASASRFSGGIFQPNSSPVWKAYYPKGNPVRIAMQHTFRLFDAAGEFGLGMTGSLQFHDGKVPEVQPDGTRSPPSVVGQTIKYYMTGLYVTADYRLRYMAAPPVAPRFMASIGGERLRETAASNPDLGTDAKGQQARSGKFGYTLLKEMALVGVALELSARGIFGKRAFDTATGYGAQDFLLSFDVIRSFDLSGHKFSQDGLLMGGSLVLLLE
jgi:hypothetical protein